MNFLVCISKVPDTTSKIEFVENGTKFNEEGVQFILNPYDEWYSLVRALELKETLGGSVTVLSVGKEDYEPILRKALAIGADGAVRIDAEPLDAYFVAEQIAQYAQTKSFDVILVGKESIQHNGMQVGAMVSAILDWAYVPLATSLNLADKTATLTQDQTAGAVATLQADLPLVISASKGMAEQRIPNMKGIMAARTKPLEVLPSFSAEALTAFVGYELPAAKTGCKMIDADNMQELVRLLHQEAKVI
jgi:electron transfer flavoprotein beta subunit